MKFNVLLAKSCQVKLQQLQAMKVSRVLLFDANQRSEGAQSSTQLETYLKDNEIREKFQV